ncbi:MAG: hypothetical protein Q7V58_09550 [Actinomycetota bacterium]|nr:hypothetical protein [Actinomycetota bacterium]
MAEPTPLQDAIAKGLADAFAAHSDADAGVMITAWCVTIEMVDPDADPWLHEIRSPGLPVWKALGMVETHANTLRGLLGQQGDPA